MQLIQTSTAVLDQILTLQLAVAWAGEGGDEPRLAWWRTDLVSEYGGEDLFRRLMPATWKWAVLEGAREAARRIEAALRQQDHDPDSMLSLFGFGFELDEKLNQRLMDLKRGDKDPVAALPGLASLFSRWNRDVFADWLQRESDVETEDSPVGRRLKGSIPQDPELAARRLATALIPLGPAYPLPHYRREA